MNDYFFYKEIKYNNKKVKNRFKELEKLYKTIPSTKGCFANIHEGCKCKSWCCSVQTPQIFYIEFLYIWKFILSNFSIDGIVEFIRNSMCNYVDGDVTKGCIFFDNEKKICKIYDMRSYNCRVYGIIPKEEFQPRYELLQKRYQRGR